MVCGMANDHKDWERSGNRSLPNLPNSIGAQHELRLNRARMCKVDGT